MGPAMVAFLPSTLNLFGVSEIQIQRFSSFSIVLVSVVLGAVIPPGYRLLTCSKVIIAPERVLTRLVLL